jgi:DNA polymerase III subunit delta
MAAEIKPAYLVAGTDQAKIDATRARLRARAETEGGAGALEVFEAGDGRSGPDAAAICAAIPAMSLTASRRYLLADGVERWKAAEVSAVAEALGSLPDDVTVVLIARGKAPAKLAPAVKSCGGEVLAYEAPKVRDLPRKLVADAAERGFRLDPAAARMLVDRMGPSTVRLQNELDRLALWVGDEGEVTADDLAEMVADTSETAIWALSDALIEGDAGRALEIAERLDAQGENVTGIVYGVASRLRQAHDAVAKLEAGRTPKQVESDLAMHPYAAKMLVRQVREADPASLRAAIGALADLEWWCRGGSDYDERVAQTLALRRAAGAAVDAAWTAG